jgi:hypothetical protein
MNWEKLVKAHHQWVDALIKFYTSDVDAAAEEHTTLNRKSAQHAHTANLLK